MPGPKLVYPVLISTPGQSTVDPDTGLETTPATLTVATKAHLSQKPVGELASAVEQLAGQTTVIALYTILVGPNEVLTAASTVVDLSGAIAEAGSVFQVEGQPADRRSLVQRNKKIFRAASMRLISDMQ
jgi:hypothetical protein